MTAIHLERARQLATAARRRADYERWKEAYRRIAETKVRSDEERQAQHEALELMEQARP
jgi:hypothetical protein